MPTPHPPKSKRRSVKVKRPRAVMGASPRRSRATWASRRVASSPSITDELCTLYGVQDTRVRKPLIMTMPSPGRWLQTVSWFGVVFMGICVMIAVVYPYVAMIFSRPSTLLLRLGE